SKEQKLSVLMLPWLGQGHLIPFLDLAKKLSERNFNIYICSSPANLDPIREKVSQMNLDSIQLIDLHLPILPDLPTYYHTTKGLPPNRIFSLFEAFDKSAPNFSNILETLKPNLVIYDFFQPWAPKLALSHNIPSVLFMIVNATCISFALHFTKNAAIDFPSKAIYLHDYQNPNYNHILYCIKNGVNDVQRILGCLKYSSEIVLVKTFREIEGKYIDYFESIVGKKIVPLGGTFVSNPIDNDEEDETIKWLNKKRALSTVFVSFGSEYYLSKEEIEELAHGLEQSNANFIWVIRFPLGSAINIEEELPKGFSERVKERGMIVTGWAPQMKILSHSSIGGFVSHCGWGSVMESLMFGVPIIGIPIQVDQPLNAKLVEEIGVGKEIVRDSEGKLHREVVEKVVKQVLFEESGEELRRKAKELSEEICKKKGEEEIDELVEKFVQLCGKK
ncbi:Glycosyltransferase, partial [Quillaja saponaria]